MSALKQFRVLELSESVAGEYCGKLLADFGAEIIKLERPGLGSPTRQLSPFVGSGDGPERSGLFAYLNTSKRSVAVDLEDAVGRQTLEQLLGCVDAVIDDHGGEWLQSRGLDQAGWAARHSALVLCSISPFGQGDGEQPAPAADLNVVHASGWGYHTPSGADSETPPLKGAGRFLPSYEAGLDAALCVVAALYDRAGGGQGRYIDVSAQAVMASRVDYVLGQMIAGDMNVSSDRQAFDLFGPAGIFPCADGYLYLWMSAPAHWEALYQLLDQPAWMNDFPEHWLERACTPERVALCRHHVGEWLKTRNKNEVTAAGQKLGLTMAPVNNARDLLACPQFEHRGFFAEVEHPVVGKASYPTVPYRLSETPARIESPAPLLNQHGEQLAQLLSVAARRSS